MPFTQEIERILRKLAALSPSGYFAGMHIRFAAPLVTYQTYSRQWTDFYTENAFALRDPMIAWGFSTVGSTRWSEIDIPDPFNIFGAAADFGMKFGVSVSVGPIKSRTIAGATRADREYTDSEIEEVSNLIHQLHRDTEPPESLTDAQREALQLIADGDRYAAAAAKLGISESALKARLTSARNRLLARTTAEAIQRAKDYRLL